MTALALLSGLGSLAVEYVSFLGRLDSISSWTPLVIVGFGSACLARWAERSYQVRLKNSALVVLLGPVFAYGLGRVGELGALLYLALMAVAAWKVLPHIDDHVALTPEARAVTEALRAEKAVKGP